MTERRVALVRISAAVVLGLLANGVAAQAAASAPVPSELVAWDALRDGAIVIFRHANAPGGGDPTGLKLGDCSSQRNLDAAGREQATRIGERLRQQRVAIGAVWASQWCRTRETLELLKGGAVREATQFNSFFGDREREPAQTAAARQALLAWRGPGALVVVDAPGQHRRADRRVPGLRRRRRAAPTRHATRTGRPTATLTWWCGTTMLRPHGKRARR